METVRYPWQANPGRCRRADGDGGGRWHGRADLMEAMFAALAQDVRRVRPDTAANILIGDLVDRGPASFDCLGMAMAGLAAFVEDRVPVEDVALTGNHDAWLRDALAGGLDDGEAALWAMNGGRETWASFGLKGRRYNATELTDALRERTPGPLRDFLAEMPYAHREGDLMFAHAGLDPRRPMDDQDPHALMWIRDVILEAKRWPFEVLVVHGHTIEMPAGAPVLHPHRICLDTGAFSTGVLTGAEFFGDEMRFVQIRAD